MEPSTLPPSSFRSIFQKRTASPGTSGMASSSVRWKVSRHVFSEYFSDKYNFPAVAFVSDPSLASPSFLEIADVTKKLLTILECNASQAKARENAKSETPAACVGDEISAGAKRVAEAASCAAQEANKRPRTHSKAAHQGTAVQDNEHKTSHEHLLPSMPQAPATQTKLPPPMSE